MYNRPIYKDPLFYLLVFAIIAILPQFQITVIDGLIGIAIQFVLFGVLPTSIRRGLRKNKNTVK